MLLAGVSLAFASLIALLLVVIWSEDHAQRLLAVAATNLIFGRLAALSFGFALGLDHFSVILPNLLMETILVLVLYPLFVFSWRQLVEIHGLHRYLSAIRAAAERNQATVRRYGILGLFIFVWSPLWMTGPVVGCAIGFIIGLPIRLNLLAVLGGTYVAIIVWGFGVRRVLDQAAHITALGPLILLALAAVILAAGYVLRRRRHKRSQDRTIS